MVFALMGFLNGLLLLVLILRNFSHVILSALKGVPVLQNVYKFTMKHHRYFAYALILFGALHGYMLLGSVYLHTGWVLYGMILLAGFFGTMNKWFKKPNLLLSHRVVALTTVGFYFVHFLFRGLLS